MTSTGSGPAPRQRRAANWGHQPLGLWWALPLGLAVTLWMLFRNGVEPAGYTLAGTLGVAALLRLVLPREMAGGLLVRSRAWDVFTLVFLGAGVAIATATLPAG